MTLANFGVCDQPKQEIEFFNLIKSNCEVIFDVGCREDADYLENSLDKSREFHMFDPNVAFLEKCESKLGGLEAPEGVENSVYFNAIGLGDVEGEMTYYSNTQSFVFRTHHTRSAPSSLSFPVKTIKSYCSEREVDRIDFLKIDTEGMEIDTLNGGKDIVNGTCKYVQFEFASTMIDRKVEPKELVSFFDDEFDLFLLQVDPPHPYYSENKKLLTELTDELYSRIEKDMYEASGCNLVAIRKELSSQYK